MSYRKEFEKLFNQAQAGLAEGISSLLRSMEDKRQRLEALESMKNKPSVDILKRVNRIAIEKEDYETCEALKDYSKQRGINL